MKPRLAIGYEKVRIRYVPPQMANNTWQSKKLTGKTEDGCSIWVATHPPGIVKMIKFPAIHGRRPVMCVR